MKVYIAGAITNDPNYRAHFTSAEFDILAQGHTPVNPAKNVENSYRDYINTGLKQLMECDAIYMLHGSITSTGAMLEYHYAKAVGIPIYVEGEVI